MNRRIQYTYACSVLALYRRSRNARRTISMSRKGRSGSGGPVRLECGMGGRGDIHTLVKRVEAFPAIRRELASSRRRSDRNRATVRSARRLMRSYPSEQRQLPPLPEAVHLREPDLAQPRDLRLHVEQLVRAILIRQRHPQRREERLVQLRRRRRHMLQVVEDSARLEQIEHLRIQRALASMRAVMDREARHYRIEPPRVAERAERTERRIEIVLDDLHGRITGKASPRRIEHRR